jgi:hypothetical protein
MDFVNISVQAGSPILDHVKGHRCGYVPNERTDDDDIKIIDTRCIAGYRVLEAPRQPVEITVAVLDALNTGSHGLRDVQQARKILEAAGLKVTLHPAELAEADRLRKAAARFLADADAIDGGLGD